MSAPSPPGRRYWFGIATALGPGGPAHPRRPLRIASSASLRRVSFQACREAFLVLGTRHGAPRGDVCLAVQPELHQGERAPVLFVGCDVLEDRRRAPVLRDDDRRALLVRTLDQRSRIALKLRERHDILELHGAILDPNPVRSHSAAGSASTPMAAEADDRARDSVMGANRPWRLDPRCSSSTNTEADHCGIAKCKCPELNSILAHRLGP
jgi:hypothetical protein